VLGKNGKCIDLTESPAGKPFQGRQNAPIKSFRNRPCDEKKVKNIFNE